MADLGDDVEEEPEPEPDYSNVVYTTGQVAKICHVAPKTVCNWFDDKILEGFKIPGSPDRRIPHNNLVVFLKKHAGMYESCEFRLNYYASTKVKNFQKDL